MDTKQESLRILEEIYQRGVELADGADLVSETVFSVKSVALLLLTRTLSHSKVAASLLDDEHVVESRTLVRCCYENFFWVASLARRKEDFLREVELDDAASRLRLVRGWRDWAKSQQDPMTDHLGSIHELMRAQYPETRQINQFQAAEDGNIAKAYLVYRELSSDSAHPSATSLSRYLELSGNGSAPLRLRSAPLSVKEEQRTLHLLCTALLGVVVTANQCLGRILRTDDLAELSLAVATMTEGETSTSDPPE